MPSRAGGEGSLTFSHSGGREAARFTIAAVMARMLTKDEISKLPTSERLDLIAELWDSLSASDVPVPESHRRALDEALLDYQRDPNAGQTWNDVKKDLRRKK